MMPRDNGGLLGSWKVPGKSGLWSLEDQATYQRADLWATDPSFSSVTLLLHCNGSNDSTSIIDSSPSPRQMVASGNAKISTAQSKFGGSSLVFDGSGDFVTTSYSTTLFDWWTSDYTIESWVYATSWSGWSYGGSNSVPCLIGNMENNTVTNYWSFGPDANSKLKLYYYNGTSVHSIITTATLPTSQWVHIAAVKTSSGVVLYINGTSSGGTFSISGTPQSSSGTPLTIGTNNNICINGYVDEIRITKGVARYTGNFTAPTAPFPSA